MSDIMCENTIKRLKIFVCTTVDYSINIGKSH